MDQTGSYLTWLSLLWSHVFLEISWGELPKSTSNQACSSGAQNDHRLQWLQPHSYHKYASGHISDISGISMHINSIQVSHLKCYGFCESNFLGNYLTAVGVFRRLTCHMLQRDAVLFSRRGSQEMWQGNEGQLIARKAHVALKGS